MTNTYTMFLKVKFILIMAIIFFLGLSSYAFSSETDIKNTSPEKLAKVAEAILEWDGKDPGMLFQKVKEANLDKNAIDSMRELNKALSDGVLPPDITSKTAEIKAKQDAAQKSVLDRVKEIREQMFLDYIKNNPEKARSLYGIGDIGSWTTTANPDVSMDIDWTVFGVDPDVTAAARDEYIKQLTADLDKNDLGLTLKDFDIVVTAEGHEKAAGVFEREGGIDWAKRNMKRFTVLQLDGSTRSYNLETRVLITKDGNRRVVKDGVKIEEGSGTVVKHIVGDPIAEMSMASQLAEVRKAATEGGDYEKMFDEKGFILQNVFLDPDKAAEANALWEKYGDLLKLTNVDYYRTRMDTATGGALDMSKHLNEEVLKMKFEPESRMRKTLKYLYRADNITRKGDARLRRALEADPLLSDPAYQKAIELAYEVTQHPETVGAVLKRNYGDTPDAALQELGERSKTAILRMAEVAYQVEMDRIILEIPTAEGRKSALDKLTNDFKIIADEGGDYSDLAKSTLEAISKVSDVNEMGAIEAMKKNWNTLDKIRHDEAGVSKQTLDYLQQTELGRKMLESGGKFLEWGSKPIYEKATGKFKSDGVDFIGEMVDSSRAKGMVIVDIAGSLSMWVEVMNNVRNSKSDADLAYALGQTLINNTFFGMILSTGYAGIVQGDNEALAKAIMYMLVPEAALPALVESLGTAAISLGSQFVFEAQLDALYIISKCGKEGEITSYFDGAGRDINAVRELIEDFLGPGGYGMAEDMIKKSKDYKMERGQGVNVFMKTAVVKAMESTLMKGNPLLFTEDGLLMNACANIRKTTEEIDYLAKTFGIEMHFEAGEGGSWSSGLGRGETAVINKLITKRNEHRAEAKEAMAQAIVRTFNERCRAEQQLNKGQDEALALLEKCRELFKRLRIEEKGMAALSAQGAPYNFISKWMTLDEVEQRTAMIALQKFIDTYRGVEEARTAAETLAARILGADRKLSPRPLTGSLPLTASPDKDMQIAREYLQALASVGDYSVKSLKGLKKGELNSEYDQDALRTLYAYRVRMVYWRSWVKAAYSAKDLHWQSEVFDQLTLDAKRVRGNDEIELLEEKEKVLLEEFKKHYDLDGEFSVKLIAPGEVKSGEMVELKVELTYSKDNEIKVLPPEILSQITYIWMSGKTDLGAKAETIKSFRLDTIGEHEFSVIAQRKTKKDGVDVQVKIGEANVTVKVLAQEISKEDKEKEKKEKLEKEKKDKEQGKDLAATIASLKGARDWEGLVALLEKESKSKETDTGKQMERTAAIDKALQELKKERLAWLVRYKEYLRSLQGLNDSEWSKFDSGMELKRDKFQKKCNNECRNCKDKCLDQANKYYDDCVGTLKEDYSKEAERLSASLKELPPLVEKLASGAYEHARWFKEVEALTKKYQLPNPYPDPVVNKIKYYSECLDQEIVDKEIEEEVLSDLLVKLNGPTQIVEVGMLVNINASVSGGNPPYNYSWIVANGYGSTASFKPVSIGDWTVRVKVTDAEGSSGDDAFVVRVGPGKVNMEGLKGDVFYGEVTLLSTLGMGLTVEETKPEKAVRGGDFCPGPFCVDYKNSGTITEKAREIPDDWFYPENGSSSGSSYIPDPAKEFPDGKAPKDTVKNEDRVVWQAEPGVTFDPPTSTDGMTKITYDRMGEIKVWCEVHKFIDGAYQTVAECEQQTVAVKPPALSISFEPANGVALVGQTVRATINASPSVESKLIDYRWLDPATSNRMQLDNNGMRIEFTVNDINPIKLKVLARVPILGDDISQVESSYTGVSFSVNAWMVQPPNLPQTWDPKKGGLKTLTKSQRATGELITLKAEVQGGNVPDPVRWEWSVNEGTTISNPISQTPTVSRSEAGSIIAKVKAADNNKRSLGQTEVSVSVIEIIPEPNAKKDVKKDNQTAAKEKKEKEEKEKAEKAQKAKKVIDEGQKAAKKGKFDEAIAKGEEARKEDPKNKEIQTHIDQVKKEKEKIDNGLKTVDQLIVSSDFQQAQEKLIALKNKASYYPPVQAMDRTLGEKWQAHIAKVNTALGDVNVKSKNKDYKEALESIEVARKTLKLSESELETLAQQEWYCKDLEGKKEKARQLYKTAKEKLDSNDFEGSIKDYKEGFSLASNLWNVNTDKTPANADDVYRQALAKKKEFDAEQLKASEEKRIEPVVQEEHSFQVAYQTNKVISVNAEEIITLSDVDIQSADKIRILIRQASGLSAKGRKDTARIGEVEFYQKGKKLLPTSVAAESVYPGGYSPGQTIDGDRKYSYLANGPRGWASELKTSGSRTWIEFTFASSVDVDKVIITTAPTDPYRLHSFELQSNVSGSDNLSVAISGGSPQIAGKYFINANGWKGSLIFSGTANRLEGVLNLGKPEKMTDIRVEGKQITFTRVVSSSITQVYTGEISGASDKLHFEGTFTSSGGVFKWVADMTEIAKKNENHDGLSKIVGKWSINANGWKGTLILKSASGQVQGILTLNIGDEQLEDVSFDGIALKFTRPIPRLKIYQVYTGTVSEKALIMHAEGTFSSNGKGASPWSADLIEPDFY